VADVQAVAAGVGEHVQHVQLGPIGELLEALVQVADGVGGVERALLLPAVLPGELDLLGQRRGVAIGRYVVGGRVGRRIGHGVEGTVWRSAGGTGLAGAIRYVTRGT
jgi:hypothetical protein